MLDRITINSNSKPENPHIVKYEGVIVNSICSQAFLFGESDMGKFKRRCGLIYNQIDFDKEIEILDTLKWK